MSTANPIVPPADWLERAYAARMPEMIYLTLRGAVHFVDPCSGAV